MSTGCSLLILFFFSTLIHHKNQQKIWNICSYQRLLLGNIVSGISFFSCYNCTSKSTHNLAYASTYHKLFSYSLWWKELGEPARRNNFFDIDMYFFMFLVLKNYDWSTICTLSLTHPLCFWCINCYLDLPWQWFLALYLWVDIDVLKKLSRAGYFLLWLSM